MDNDSAGLESGTGKEQERQVLGTRARFIAETLRAFKPKTLHDLTVEVIRQLKEHPDDISPEVNKAFRGSDLTDNHGNRFGLLDEYIEKLARLGFQAALNASEKILQEELPKDAFDRIGNPISQLEGFIGYQGQGRDRIAGILFCGAVNGEIEFESRTTKNRWSDEKVKDEPVVNFGKLGFDGVKKALQACIDETKKIVPDDPLERLLGKHF